MKRRLLFVSAIAAALALTPHFAAAQVGGGPTWIALDQSPPGSPPTIQFDARSSSPSKSFFDVFVHGFYIEHEGSPAGMPFTHIFVSEMGEIGQTGAPNLPAAQLSLALPQGIQGVHLAQASLVTSAEYFPPDPCWPRTIPELDDPNGTPEVFVQDQAIYALTTPWPPMDGDARVSVLR